MGMGTGALVPIIVVAADAIRAAARAAACACAAGRASHVRAGAACVCGGEGGSLTRKSKISVFVIAAAMSFRCRVRRLFSSACIQERRVSSRMNISHACIIPHHKHRHVLIVPPAGSSQALPLAQADLPSRQIAYLYLGKQHWRLSADHAHILV